MSKSSIVAYIYVKLYLILNIVIVKKLKRIMVMTRYSDENIAFEQQQKSRYYLVSNKSSDRHIGFIPV